MEQTIAKDGQKPVTIGILRDMLPRGSRIFVVKRFKSREGDYRTADVYRARISNGSIELDRITGSVCNATGFRYDRKHESLGIGGSGFGFGESVRDRLAYVLYGDEKALEYQEV